MGLDIDRDADLLRLYNLPLQQKRRIQELHGMFAAFVYDGHISNDEIGQLRDWFAFNPDIANEWPMSDLAYLLDDITSDGVVDHEERHQLLRLLEGTAARHDRKPASSICDYPDRVVFEARRFCFTGRLEMGTRKRAAAAVVDLGGIVEESPVARLHYLVLGDLGSENWMQSRYGSKIKTVMDRRQRGAETLFLDEATFVRAVVDAGR